MSVVQKWLMGMASIGIFLMAIHMLFDNKGILDLLRVRRDQLLLVKQNAKIRNKNRTLYREIDRLNNDPEYLEEVVRKETQMVRPGEIVVRMKDKRKATP